MTPEVVSPHCIASVYVCLGDTLLAWCVVVVSEEGVGFHKSSSTSRDRKVLSRSGSSICRRALSGWQKESIEVDTFFSGLFRRSLLVLSCVRVVTIFFCFQSRPQIDQSATRTVLQLALGGIRRICHTTRQQRFGPGRADGKEATRSELKNTVSDRLVAAMRKL